MKKKNGFTLVELLTVLAILAILMSLASISVVSILNKQKETLGLEMEDNLREAAIAFLQEESIKLRNCPAYFSPENPGTENTNCYHIFTVEEIIRSGLFEDNSNYCKKDGKVLVYKLNQNGYSDIRAHADDKICR